MVALWTSDDPEVALNMLFMYLKNARLNNWWDEVTLVIWGPSAKLSVEDEMITEGLKELKAEGVILEACVVCADRYGVAEELEKLGVVVRPMGEPLSNYIKEGKNIIAV